MKRFVTVFSLVLLGAPLDAGADSYLVKVSPKQCAQGLYQQPGGGPFSVFLFCDDAAGVNVGVVNTSGGAGPGSIELPQPKIWDKWDVNNRFWQEREWATDITSFAWSPDLKSLYVATSYIYGTGSLYKLSLITKTFTRLIPNSNTREAPNHAHSVEILDVNLQTGDVSVNFSFFDRSKQKREVTRIVVK